MTRTPAPAPPTVAARVSPIAPHFHPGFAIGPDGDFYVGERFDQRVRRFSAKGKKKGTFIDGLPDMPELLVHVLDRASGIAPRRS